MKTKSSFAVIGLGRFGYNLAKTLAEKGSEVIAADVDEERIKDLADIVTSAMVLDSTDEKALRESGIDSVDTVIVAIGSNIEASVVTVMILSSMKIKTILAKANTNLHGEILLKLGVSQVIYPERDTGIRVANSLLMKNVLDEIFLTPEYSIFEVKTPTAFVNKNLKDLDLRRKYGMSILLIERGREMVINPLGDETIRENDILVALGKREDFQKLES